MLNRFLRPHFAADGQVPPPRRVLLAVPRPVAPVREVDPQLPARAVAQDAARPVAQAKPLHEAFHGDRFARCLPFLRRAPAAQSARPDRRPGPLGPDPLGAADTGNEHLFYVVRHPQEGGLFAVTGIDADPFEPHSPRPAHDVQRVPAFRGQRACLERNVGLLSARQVVGPGLRQVQPHIDRRMPLAVTQNTATTGSSPLARLAVVNLAQPHGPLPRHAHRTFALLGEAAFVDDQAEGRLAAQQAVGVTADLRHDRLVVRAPAASCR